MDLEFQIIIFCSIKTVAYAQKSSTVLNEATSFIQSSQDRLLSCLQYHSDQRYISGCFTVKYPATVMEVSLFLSSLMSILLTEFLTNGEFPKLRYTRINLKITIQIMFCFFLLQTLVTHSMIAFET
uniref:Uncharacterized protein n=1 Tax=Romanomermis culicivorax TaxID=13658 RepID=A0A915JGK3_ROMCU